MSAKWETALKRLQELQKELEPRPLIIELIFCKGKDREEIARKQYTVKELTSGNMIYPEGVSENDWYNFRVVSGTDLKDVKEFLDWYAPSVID